MRSLVRAPFVAVKRTFKVPSSVVVAGTAARPLDCSRRSPNDLLGRHPASSGRAGHACAAAGVDGQAARVCREVGERPLSSTPTESVVARVALGGPSASLPNPSPRHLLPRTAQNLAAHHPTHRRSIGRPSPLSRARRPRAAPSRPACRPAPPRRATSPRLLRPGGRGALESVAIRRVCPVSSPVRAGSSRPRGPLELDPPRAKVPWAPSRF